MSRFQAENRLVFGNLNATNETEIMDNIYDRTIITTNSVNILNIMSETNSLNPDEEVIRKRGRKKTPKVWQLPLRRSPRKSSHSSAIDSTATESHSQSALHSDQNHDYFLRTPKKTPTKTPTRTPSKLRLTPSKALSSATPLSPRRVSLRKRLQLDGNDSGIGLSPALSAHEVTPIVANEKERTSGNQKAVPKTKKSSKRRRRRYF